MREARRMASTCPFAIPLVAIRSGYMKFINESERSSASIPLKDLLHCCHLYFFGSSSNNYATIAKYPVLPIGSPSL
jgi:hypothetical protein